MLYYVLTQILMQNEITMTHNERITTFFQLSCHLQFDANAYVVESTQRGISRFKYKRYKKTRKN